MKSKWFIATDLLSMTSVSEALFTQKTQNPTLSFSKL